MDSLYEHIPRRLLPAEYGGEAESIVEIAENWKNKLVERGQWFEEDAAFKTDETKRLGKPKNANLLFGTEGSFRSLEFD